MRWTIITTIVLALLIGLPVTCYAGKRAQNFQERAYDPDTVATITGKVVKVEEVQRDGGRSGGIHVVMDTDDGVVQAHLGPKWYISGLNLDLKPGDNIEVTGSKLYVVEDLYIIVRELKRGDETVTLRDISGVPNWSGWRKGGGTGGKGKRGGL
jgi:hypothetical protein